MREILLILVFFNLGCSEAISNCHNPVTSRFEIVDEYPKGFLNIYSPYDCLKAPDQAYESEYRVVFSFKVDVEPGDFIKASGFVGVTNPMPKPMGLWKYWTLGESPTDIHGIWGSRPMGPNITPLSHHDVVFDVGHWDIDFSGEYYLNFVIYAASGERDLFNEFVIIDSGYSNFLIENIGGDSWKRENQRSQIIRQFLPGVVWP